MAVPVGAVRLFPASLEAAETFSPSGLERWRNSSRRLTCFFFSPGPSIGVVLVWVRTRLVFFFFWFFVWCVLLFGFCIIYFFCFFIFFFGPLWCTIFCFFVFCLVRAFTSPLYFQPGLGLVFFVFGIRFSKGRRSL